MEDNFVLEVLASVDKPIVVKELLNLLTIAEANKQYKNDYSMKMSIYVSLYRLHKKGYVLREHDRNLSYKRYRFCCSTEGLNHLGNLPDMNLVREVILKVS